MTISMYQASAPVYVQYLKSISAVLDKGAAFAESRKLDPATLLQARLYPDMMPLAFQIELINHHSVPAIAGCKTGVFKPPPLIFSTLDYAGLQKMIGDTLVK